MVPGHRCHVDVEFSVAFQPIVDAATRTIISFEALVRGPHGEPSTAVFAKVAPRDLHAFDQACRLKALALAARLRLGTYLNLNFLPNSRRGTNEYLWATVEASGEVGFPANRLIVELTESDALPHSGSVHGVFETFSAVGFQVAIDDFGRGLASVRRLTECRPNFLKLDRRLISDIHVHRVKQVVVKGIRKLCDPFGIQPLAEGVEKVEEYRWLRRAGIDLFQGFYFARPSFESLTEVGAALF